MEMKHTTRTVGALLTSLLLGALPLTSVGCRAHAKPRPNDEVTVPMSEEDESALRGDADEAEADEDKEEDDEALDPSRTPDSESSE